MIKYGILLLGVCASAMAATACTLQYDPVCASDGTTYSNECFYNANRKSNPGLKIMHKGNCDNRSRREVEQKEDKEECACPDQYSPICANDGVTYPNVCEFMCAQRKNTKLIPLLLAECADRAPDNKNDTKECVCQEIVEPVCGTDGKTYSNKCELECVSKDQNEIKLKYKGECKKRKIRSPQKDASCVCTFEYRPVCGSDGKTYPNMCTFSCKKREVTSLAISHYGQCKNEASMCPCTREYNPQCGTDGVTYNNPCLLRCAAKTDNNIHLKHQGECANTRRALGDDVAVGNAKIPQKGLMCPCTREYKPQCGTNGVTYANPCLLRCAAKTDNKIQLKHQGECVNTRRARDIPQKDTSSCVCPFIYKPICGTDGKTYPNMCALECKQREVLSLVVRHQGQCKNEASMCTCTREYNPQCGTNGVTYNNPCLFRCAAKTDNKIQLKHQGECANTRRARDARIATLCACPKNLRKVCGSNNVTYLNPCLLECAAKYDSSIRMLHEGDC